MSPQVPAFLLSLALVADGTHESPLSARNIDALLSCAGNTALCEASDWELADELVKREGREGHAARYAAASASARRVLVFALYRVGPDLQVMSVMRQASASRDEEVAYFALNYRAKRCDACRDFRGFPRGVPASPLVVSGPRARPLGDSTGR